MLDFGIEADTLTRGRLLGAHQLHDLREGRHLIQPVIPRIGGTQRGDAFFRAQGAQFRQREVLGKPARDFLPINRFVAAAVFEFLAAGDIGGARQFVFVARHQHQILRGDQIGLDIIRALIDRQFVSGERMLGPLGTRAAVGDDEHILSRGGHRGQCHQRDQSKAADHSSSLKPTRIPPGYSTIGRLMMLGC